MTRLRLDFSMILIFVEELAVFLWVFPHPPQTRAPQRTLTSVTLCYTGLWDQDPKEGSAQFKKTRLVLSALKCPHM